MKLDVEHRIREGVKAALEEILQEEILQEEMTDILETSYRELTPYQARRGNGHYTRNLLIPAGKIQRLEIPRDWEGEFVSEVFERYKRMTGADGEEAVFGCNSRGSRVRKIGGVTDASSKVKIGKDAVSRIAKRCAEVQRACRERSLKENN